MSNQPSKEIFTYFDNTIRVIRRVPIIGKLIAGILSFIVGILLFIGSLVYWFFICTYLVFIIMPYQIIRGLINPKSVEGQFPFIGTHPRNIEPPFKPTTRWDFVIPLLLYIMIFGVGIFGILLSIMSRYNRH